MMKVPITKVKPSVYHFRWKAEESDGTLSWRETTMIVVEVRAGGKQGFGWTYSDRIAAQLIHDQLSGSVENQDAMDTAKIWGNMYIGVRNLGRPGIVSSALSAVDNALWDLKARILDVSLCSLLGGYQDSVELYWSGGFTSYSAHELQDEFSQKYSEGFKKFKMKVGRNPAQDPSRVKAVRGAIGSSCELFTDANGAYKRKQALEMSWKFWEHDVRWFEEPVSANDFEGARLLRDRCPPGMSIALGEYGYELDYFDALLKSQCIDVIQIDVSRCGGITAFLRIAALAGARHLPISSHTTPAQHLHVCSAIPEVMHMEYFKDHVIAEQALFDGIPLPKGGWLSPDIGRPGNGIELKRSEAARFAA